MEMTVQTPQNFTDMQTLSLKSICIQNAGMVVLANFTVIFQKTRFPLIYKEFDEKHVMIFEASLYMEDKTNRK
jgi:hypothetical protein